MGTDAAFASSLSIMLCACVVVCFVFVVLLILYGLWDIVHSQQRVITLNQRALDVLQHVRTFLIISSATDDAHLVRTLRMASHMDMWHLNCVVNHMLLEVCDLQPTAVFKRRLSHKRIPFLSATKARLSEQRQLAEEKISAIRNKPPSSWPSSS